MRDRAPGQLRQDHGAGRPARDTAGYRPRLDRALMDEVRAVAAADGVNATEGLHRLVRAGLDLPADVVPPVPSETPRKLPGGTGRAPREYERHLPVVDRSRGPGPLRSRPGGGEDGDHDGAPGLGGVAAITVIPAQTVCARMPFLNETAACTFPATLPYSSSAAPPRPVRTHPRGEDTLPHTT
ncbi:MAG: hypothetical protein V7633_923, partial [Pseudonocardia sp.]